MAGSVIGIAGSGRTAQGGPLVIGHGIGNASVESSHRQQAGQAPMDPGSDLAGQGVTVETVRSAYSQFLDDCVLQAQAQSAHLDAYATRIRQIDELLAVPASGLSSALQSFFSGVQDVASHPASVPSRQQLLGSAQALAASFWSLGTHLAEMRQALNQRMSDIVAEINSLAEDLARINERLPGSAASGQAQEDLERRDLLVAQLNMLVRVSAVRQSDGSVNLSLATGHSLLLGVQAFALAAAPSAEDPQNHGILHLSNGARTPLDPAAIQGGQLGGLLAFRSDALDPAQNQLGRVAVALAQTFNAQHRLGMDLQGDAGQEFFHVPPAAVLDYRDNAGTAVIAADRGNVGALTGSDYRLQHNAGTWLLTRLGDNVRTVFAGFPHTLDGVTLTLASGAAASGDSFLIQPTRDAARDIAVLISDAARIAAAAPVRYEANGIVYNPNGGIGYNRNGGIVDNRKGAMVDNRNGGIYDNRNALLLAALQVRGTIAGGSASYQEACDRIAQEVRDRAHAIEVQIKAQDALVSQARKTQRSLPGANLDEEAATLFRHQQAYQACGKALQAAARLFDSLLETSE
ncbi:MAG TPA: flagellar hook-associated protein FlgK [Burkholderiales bacterium]|jgi:flagellar hook-associated protein 1 FlgK